MYDINQRHKDINIEINLTICSATASYKKGTIRSLHTTVVAMAHMLTMTYLRLLGSRVCSIIHCSSVKGTESCVNRIHATRKSP